MKFIKLFTLLSSVIFLAISCKSSDKKTTEVMNNLHRKWMLVEYRDFTKAELIKLGANIDLTQKENGGAKMGCNGMFFGYKMKNQNQIDFSQVRATMMYCEGKMKLEESFVEDLPKMNRYKIEGHFLTLSDGRMTMKFVAEDWD
ncbi:MAG: META domain-containing protein [Bergeyella sp.]